MRAPARWIARLAPLVPPLVAVAASSALARVGGGEHFDSGTGRANPGGDGGELGEGFELMLWLFFKHPAVGVPLLFTLFVGYIIWDRRQSGDGSTRRAIQLAEAKRRVVVTAAAVDAWVRALQQRDPGFDLIPFLERTGRQFVELQRAWARRDLEPVRRYLSDATFQRLTVQLELLRRLGVRDAVTDVEVFDLKIVGLEQSGAYDSLHVAVTAQARDAEAPAGASDDEARAIARGVAPERFIEVWTFARRPGVATKPGADLSQGRCPGCGAPYAGGAANRCESCGAIVNSGNHDWVLTEITQGSEFRNRPLTPEGLAKVRQSDPELSTEALEDRAALIFWRWIEAQATGSERALAKVCTAAFLTELRRDLEYLSSVGKECCFVDCAVGAVNAQQFTQTERTHVAAVEVRWSAKQFTRARGEPTPPGPSRPQRSVLLLERVVGAKSLLEAGLSTSRCPRCAAPLTDNGQPRCEFCGAVLEAGQGDWVLKALLPWEGWMAGGGTPASAGAVPVGAKVPDREERERLLCAMALLARADGVVSQAERKHLRMAASRWDVPWPKVELALEAQEASFRRQLPERGSAESEVFLRELVALALVDGRIDPQERRLLATTARHLGLTFRLDALLPR